MSTIYTRATKGSALTWTEGDANITNLNTDKIELTDLSVTDSGGDGALSYNNATGVFTYTGPSASDVRAHFAAGTGITLTDGTIATTITQYTDALARGAVSVTDSGGDGSLAYNSSTGVITYTGPSATDVRAHFSAGNSITITDGAVALSTTPTLGTPASGNLSNCTADGTNGVGFRVIPSAGAEKTGSYTLQTADRGEFVQVGSGGSITVPNSTFAAGDVVVIYNNHTAAITITLSTTNAYIAGTNTNKTSVSLATRGVCNILFVSATVAILTGNIS